MSNWNVEKLLKEAKCILVSATLATPESTHLHSCKANLLLTRGDSKWYLSGMPLSDEKSTVFEVDNIAQFLVYLCANTWPAHVHLTHAINIPKSPKTTASSEITKSRICLFITEASFSVIDAE